MFSTTLRQRPDLPSIIPLLTTSTNPKLRETTLQTHDLALPISSPAPEPAQPTHQPFLLLTPTSLSNPDILELITRFSTLTAHPAPTIAFILSTATTTKQETGARDGLQGYMHLQTLTHTLPHPPPVLPIPVPAKLLPLLQFYTTPLPVPAPAPPSTSTSTLSLLPHLTSSAPAKPLSTHDANVLSDLCHSLDEVIGMAGSERVLGEWFGEREAKGMREFWEGEWIVE